MSIPTPPHASVGTSASLNTDTPMAVRIRNLTMHYMAGPLKFLAGHDLNLQRLFDRLVTTSPKLIRRLVSLGFESHHALDSLELDVPEGGIYGFLGRNGAGKTTTIKILVGLLEPLGGEADIFGVSVRNPAARNHIGFMPENPYFYEYLTSMETMMLYGSLSGMNRVVCRRRAEELLVQFGLKDAVHSKVRGFSKGMRQRLGLAQALLHDPKLLILDEPMSGLDPLGRKAIRDAILDIARQNKTVFFSSHILSDVEDICDRVCLIHHGKKLAEGPLNDLLERHVMSVTVAFSGLDEPVAAALAHDAVRHVRRGDSDVFDVHTQEDAERLVRAGVDAGGKLTRLTPQHESLEDYFVRKTQADDAAKANVTPASESGAE